MDAVGSHEETMDAVGSSCEKMILVPQFVSVVVVFDSWEWRNVNW